MQTSRFSYENLRSKVKITTKSQLPEYILRNIFWIFFDFFSFHLSILWLLSFMLFDFSPVLFVAIFIPLILMNIYTSYLILLKFYKFKVNEFTFYTDKVAKPVRIVFLSDIHVGTAYFATRKLRLRKLIKEVNQIDKDILLLGGDFLTYSFKEDLLKILGEFSGQKIAVYGNHDCYYWKHDERNFPEDYSKQMPITLIKTLEKQGIPVFFNESKEVLLNDQKLQIGGIPDMYDLNFDLDKTFEGKSTDQFRILLSHNPDISEFITDEDSVDLILSGHLHSGQIYSKVTGPLLPMPSKYKQYTQGIYQLSPRTSLLISQGAGYSGTRFKVGVENEIMIINLSPIRP